MRVILASTSPRRRELMKELGLPFEVRDSGLEEVLDPRLTPLEQARSLAVAKAEAAAAKEDGGLLIGADTLVVIGNRILGKPSSRREAVAMLGLLSGRVHQVLTGVAVLERGSGRRDSSVVATDVRMRAFSETEADQYARTGEPMDKAGAYAIQEKGGLLVETFRGCYNNVIGFPLCVLAEMLAGFGLPVPDRPCRGHRAAF